MVHGNGMIAVAVRHVRAVACSRARVARGRYAAWPGSEQGHCTRTQLIIVLCCTELWPPSSALHTIVFPPPSGTADADIGIHI